MTEEFTIALARLATDVEATGEWTRSRGDGVNPVSRLATVLKPIALVWLTRATEAHVPRAQAFADAEGWTLVRVPKGTKDPLEFAKQALTKLCVDK